MNQVFEEATCLNNFGVAALVDGAERKAIEAFTTSIKVMKQVLKPGTDIKTLKSNGSRVQQLNTVEIPDVCSSETFFFREAIEIPFEGEETPLDIYVYSAAVIFNLALAHQVHAAKGNLTFLSKAERLYKTILKLIGNDIGHMRAAVMLKLASINNMSYIRFENGNFKEAREGLSQLNQLMKNADQKVFEEPEVQGLLMSVLLLKDPKVAPAA